MRALSSYAVLLILIRGYEANPYMARNKIPFSPWLLAFALKFVFLSKKRL